MRIAVKIKELMMTEIETMVDLKVKDATESYRKDIRDIQSRNQQLQSEVRSLRSDVDNLEQYSRRNCIRISGIDEANDENVEHVVRNIAERLKVDITPADMDRCHRVGRPYQNRPREIIVKLTNYRARK